LCAERQLIFSEVETLMKFSLVRPALALGVALTLAACGGGKATYPISVTVSNVKYPGLVLSNNGQDVAVPVPAKAGDDVTVVFPKQIEYGTQYAVIPKGQPQHQTCQPGSPDQLKNYNQPSGTAGLLESIDVRYSCTVNTFPITGVIKGLTGTGLVLANGSTGAYFDATPVPDANKQPTDIAFRLLNPGGTTYGVPYLGTYNVVVLSQPSGQTCTVENDTNQVTEKIETAGAVTDVVVTCVAAP
jgi:hypothetical protein